MPIKVFWTYELTGCEYSCVPVTVIATTAVISSAAFTSRAGNEQSLGSAPAHGKLSKHAKELGPSLTASLFLTREPHVASASVGLEAWVCYLPIQPFPYGNIPFLCKSSSSFWSWTSSSACFLGTFQLYPFNHLSQPCLAGVFQLQGFLNTMAEISLFAQLSLGWCWTSGLSFPALLSEGTLADGYAASIASMLTATQGVFTSCESSCCEPPWLVERLNWQLRS